jgi:hypothetical protein
VEAHAEPSVMARVIEQFVKRGLMPKRCMAVLDGPAGEALVIDIQVTGVEPEVAEHIARSLGQLAYVERVLFSQAHRAA